MTERKFARYDAYKDSAVEWLREMPAHWQMRRLKDISSIQYSNVDKKSHEDEIPIELCNYVDVYKNSFIDSSLDFMKASATLAEIKRFAIKKHDVLVTKDSETCEDIANPALVLADLPGVICGYHLAQIRTDNRTLYPPFLLRLFQSSSYSFRFIIYAKGITRVGLSTSVFTDALTPLPPFPEQCAIAAYLDTHTATLDRQIALLTQKVAHYADLKQSLINHTVTHGLDPAAPLKDSGIEWIGEIPAHWEVKRVKEIGLVVLGKMLDNDAVDGKFYRSYLKSKNVGWFRVDISSVEQMYFTSAEMEKYRLRAGDILLSEGGEVGKTALWENEIDECYIQNSVHKVTVSKENYPRYFLYYSVMLGHTKYYDSIVNQVSIKHLTKEKLLKVFWLRPPLPEQRAIAAYLDTHTATLDRIIETINAKIATLQELRQTLINDVVTGKIKVV